MLRIDQLLAARRVFKQGRAGDAVVLKADGLGARTSPRMAALLAPLRGHCPRIDLAELERLPEGTLGHAYARHMRDHGLSPLELSGRLDPEIVERNVLGVRYAVTHDIFHVVLGYDTSYPGEMGVLAFTVAQGYGPVGPVGLTLAALVYGLAAPLRAPATLRALVAGWRAGKRTARCLLVERLEDRWAEPLAEVRRDLGLAGRG
jgi:ubiquinone biosynthesis protein Coq4